MKKKNSKVMGEVHYEYTWSDVVPKNVTHVRFYPSVVKVRIEAFECRDKLREVILNDGLREIGRGAFQGCVALQSIELTSTVTEIGQSAFWSCTDLKKVVLNDGLREIGYRAFTNCKSLQRIVISSNVLEISAEAFWGCTDLREVVLNDGLKKIGYRAFANCKALQSITIPSTVYEIGAEAFISCANLREVQLNEGLTVSHTFRDCNNTLREVVVNYGIKKIGDRVFQDTSIERITIPSTVTEIGKYSFSGCSELREVALNEGLTKIGQIAFAGCKSLQSIVFPSTLIKIGSSAFYDCSSLREAVLNDGINRIVVGDYTFSGCNNLREVVIKNKEMQINNRAFEACISLERFKFQNPGLLTRLNDIIQAGQREIEAKMDAISAVEWRGGELVIPAVIREIDRWGRLELIAEADKEKLAKVEELITYYEMKEATTLFELALWKATIDQAEEASDDINRDACRIDVPGPVKDTILQYLQDNECPKLFPVPSMILCNI